MAAKAESTAQNALAAINSLKEGGVKVTFWVRFSPLGHPQHLPSLNLLVWCTFANVQLYPLYTCRCARPCTAQTRTTVALSISTQVVGCQYVTLLQAYTTYEAQEAPAFFLCTTYASAAARTRNNCVQDHKTQGLRSNYRANTQLRNARDECRTNACGLQV